MAQMLAANLAVQLSIIARRMEGPHISLVFGVKKLHKTLVSISAVLADAEERQITECAVKRWLDKLNLVLEEVDDVLDEWNTAIIKSSLIEKPRSASVRFLEKLFPLSHRISHKIYEVNRKLEDIHKQQFYYNFVWNQGMEVQVIDRTIVTTSFIDESDVCGREKYVFGLEKYVYNLDESDVCGRQKDVYNLVENVLDMDSNEKINPCVISLVGMGGIGKTIVAKLVYNKDVVCAHFDTRIWIHVSNPFNQFRVSKEIIESFDSFVPNFTELSSLLAKIADLIREKRFFLVLDDVWSENSTIWEPFKYTLKAGARGSKILVTTRNCVVARMMESAITINLNVLSENDCWLLFSKIAFSNRSFDQIHELDNIAREIAKKCKGLPHVAIALGSLMRSKGRKEFMNILDINLLELERCRKAILVPLLDSYYDLSLIERQCFLYCAVFPKDTVILVNDLIQLWMAQNYVEVQGDMEEEILGYGYFESLAMRSFFQDFERNMNDGRIISCKMHDIVHDFALLLTENNFFPVVVDGDESKIAASMRHLSLTFARQAQFPKVVYDAKAVRTLLTWNSRHAGINNDLPFLCQQLTRLRALNLSASSIERIPDEIGNLEYLRFLDLSSNYKIEELPDTLCNLCNLKSLNVSRCYMLKKLPQGIGKLINLRHLGLEGTNFLKMLPKGIGRLICLRTLTKFIRRGNDKSEGCGLEELQDMNKLKGALEIRGLGNVVDLAELENAQLKRKVSLHCLYLGFDKEGEEKGRMVNDLQVLNALEPFPGLKDLQIHLYPGTMMHPSWLMSLFYLKVLKLTKCSNLEHLPPLSKLPSLESLEILNAHSLKKVGVEFLGIESRSKRDEGSTSSLTLFPNLNSLTFSGLKELREWDGIGERGEGDGVSIMPRLQILTVCDCPKLKTLPDFLRVTLIKELHIEYCSQISDLEMLLTSYEYLKVLLLRQSENLEHLPPFGKLPFLESLSLWNMDSVKSVGPELLGIESNSKDSFPNLKFLEFWSFREWEEWVGIGRKGEVMPRLLSLVIYNCPKLKSFPDFLPNTPLAELRISGSPILKQSCQREAGSNWHKIAHIPNIKIND